MGFKFSVMVFTEHPQVVIENFVQNLRETSEKLSKSDKLKMIKVKIFV